MGYIVVRGAGDLATGVIQKLHRAGLDVVTTEIERPLAVRRQVALSECIYKGEYRVEDILARRVEFAFEIDEILKNGIIPVIIDPEGEIIRRMRPFAVVDATLAKKNNGTNRSMSGITIALGPGFYAPIDVDCVIETKRGNDLGRLIFNGCAAPDTGIPGDVAGKSCERLLRGRISGVLNTFKQIGDVVKEGEAICEIVGDGVETIYAKTDGFIRGLLRDNTYVAEGVKLGDIDPRISELENIGRISDKSKKMGDAVLEAVLVLKNKTNGFGS